MQVSGDFGSGEIRIDSRRIQAPHFIQSHAQLDDLLIVVVAARSLDVHQDSDFSHIPERNVVAFDEDGDLIWRIPVAPDGPREDGSNSYQAVIAIDGTVFCRHVNGISYEVDVERGSIVESRPDNYLPIGGKWIELEDTVHKVIQMGQRIFVFAGDLYGFDSEGNELWQTEERRGTIYKDGDRLLEKRERGPRTHEFYRLDKDTGDRIAKIEVENTPNGWAYLQDVTDGE